MDNTEWILQLGITAALCGLILTMGFLFFGKGNELLIYLGTYILFILILEEVRRGTKDE